jgi:DNA repair photolyase
MKTQRITPKRRRKYLAEKNLRTWVGVFVRRDPNAEPIPIDRFIDRYLEDTKMNFLREDPKSMESLRQGLAEAMWHHWALKPADDGLVHGARLSDFVKRGGKFYFTIPSATILNMGSGFIHKDLCSAGTVTAGTACVSSCAYCSVGSTMFRSPDTAILRLLGIDHRDAVIRRLDPAKTLREQLTFRDGSPRFKDPGDRRVVFLSPIVDPLPTIELLEESLELILLIMELTNWEVRVLTKSMFVRKLAERIPENYRQRIIYGLSLGILDDGIGKAVEKMTSPPSLRIKAYRELQEQGLRTYSMHCPVLPQKDYKAYAERLAASANWEADELVWVEALNSRGPSNERTIDALGGAGFSAEAAQLASVTSSHDAWEFGYNRPLFHALADVCPPGKLRYLVYVNEADRDYWMTQVERGAVVLGKEKSLDESDDDQ